MKRSLKIEEIQGKENSSTEGKRRQISSRDVQKKALLTLLLPEGVLPKIRKGNEDDVTGERDNENKLSLMCIFI